MAEYTSTPVNLLAGWADGSILSALYAPILTSATGNQVLDGTVLHESEENLEIASTSSLPHML